jgi:N-methylhydantoinase B
MRDAGRVREDVVEKWITRERAREIYGVAIDAAGNIDHAATARLRAANAAAAE